MKKAIPVSTASTIHGVTIQASIGFVSSHVIAGTNIFSDVFAAISDIFGGRSESYKKQLNAIKNEAIQELMDNALKLGGNAIVGMSIDLDEVAGGGKSMFMITASGTAVSIDKSTAVSSERKIGSNAKAIDHAELKDIIFRHEIITLAKQNELEFSDDVMEKIIECEIFEIRDYVLENILKFSDKNIWIGADSNDVSAFSLKNYVSAYFSNMPQQLASESLYSNLGNNHRYSQIILKIIKDCYLFDYQKIIKLLASNDLAKKELAIEIIALNKLTYTKDDIEALKLLNAALNDSIKPISNIYEVKKMIGTKNVWKCLCEREINEQERQCQDCGKNIYGLANFDFLQRKDEINAQVRALESNFQDHES